MASNLKEMFYKRMAWKIAKKKKTKRRKGKEEEEEEEEEEKIPRVHFDD